MRFEWDENKRLLNLQRQGIDFADVWQVFENEVYTILDDRFEYGEIRWISYGLLFGEVLAVSYTATVETIRIISIRKGKKNTLKKFGTDVESLKNMTDEEIDYSDIPPITDEMWKMAF